MLSISLISILQRLILSVCYVVITGHALNNALLAGVQPTVGYFSAGYGIATLSIALIVFACRNSFRADVYAAVLIFAVTFSGAELAAALIMNLLFTALVYATVSRTGRIHRASFVPSRVSSLLGVASIRSERENLEYVQGLDDWTDLDNINNLQHPLNPINMCGSSASLLH